MQKNNGWVRLHRKIMDGKYWFAEPFTKAQAWVDLLLLANYRTGDICKRGITFEVQRGQVGFSEEALAKRWKWSRGKVRRFISELTSDNSVKRVPAVPKADIQTVQQNGQKTVQQNKRLSYLISIINYDQDQTNDTTNGTTERTKNGTGTINSKEVLRREGRKSPAPTPENFPITDKMKEYAKTKGYLGDLETLTEKFLNFHRAKGSKFASWESAWRNWLLNELKFHPPGPSAADLPLNNGRSLDEVLS